MEEIPVSTLALPGQPCQTPPRAEWTDPEKWVWQQVCEGKIADFNTLHKEELDPRDSDGWSQERLISPEFLETILLHDPFQSAVPRQGVRIVGAWVKEPLELENARLTHPWRLDKSRIDAEVRLSDLQSTDSISFERSTFSGGLTLILAKVDGQLDMTGAKCTGTLNMDALEVGNNLFMSEGAEFADVAIRGAKIGAQLDLDRAKVTGTLNMNGLSVGTDLFMRDGAEFKDIDLNGAKVDGQLDMTGAKVTGALSMESVTVGAALFMREAEFGKEIFLIFADIGGNLDLSDATLASLDMTGCRVKGELRLGSGRHPKPNWAAGSRLTLRNVVVGAVNDGGEAGSWPERLDLEGFTYTHLGGLYSGEGGGDLAARKPKWFRHWLEKDPSYTPQPYHQLAGTLRAMGYPEKANAILYAGKERERHQAQWLKRLGLTALKWTIGYGYGYRYFVSLLWVAAITLIGALVLDTLGQEPPPTLAQRAAFSFDLLLPIIELHKDHKIDFDGWQRYYFYFHKLIGFLLASFVVAGLSGITKK